jgi:hypothetical protein
MFLYEIVVEVIQDALYFSLKVSAIVVTLFHLSIRFI